MSKSNFEEKIDRLFKEKRIAKGDIQIWGGEIKEDDLRQFIGKWDQLGMPIVILETVEKMVMVNHDLSTLDHGSVDRIRIFGEDGDLDIRRDINCFKWRYIGKNKDIIEIIRKDFWEENPDVKFFVEEKRAILWGKDNDRVAKADLSYPVEGQPKMVKIRYKTLSNHGAIAFTWLLAIEGEM